MSYIFHHLIRLGEDFRQLWLSVHWKSCESLLTVISFQKAPRNNRKQKCTVSMSVNIYINIHNTYTIFVECTVFEVPSLWRGLLSQIKGKPAYCVFVGMGCKNWMVLEEAVHKQCNSKISDCFIQPPCFSPYVVTYLQLLRTCLWWVVLNLGKHNPRSELYFLLSGSTSAVAWAELSSSYSALISALFAVSPNLSWGNDRVVPA